MDATAGYLKWTVLFGAAPAILNVVMAYMVRAEGSSLHASIGTMSGCLLNIILDPIFILPWGDIIVSTHVCPDAPTRPHKPVAFMDSPVEMAQVNKEELSDELDAVLSVDTTKGNRIINTRGFAISPTVKEGYILKVSESVLDIMQTTTGRLPYVYALSVQDITPYGNDLYHLNSILQPATGTKAPVIGVAITTEVPVAGCATGATHITDCEEAARFMLEVAKAYARGECSFYDEDEFTRIRKLYGNMNHLQTLGKDA